MVSWLVVFNISRTVEELTTNSQPQAVRICVNQFVLALKSRADFLIKNMSVLEILLIPVDKSIATMAWTFAWTF